MHVKFDNTLSAASSTEPVESTAVLCVELRMCRIKCINYFYYVLPNILHCYKNWLVN